MLEEERIEIAAADEEERDERGGEDGGVAGAGEKLGDESEETKERWDAGFRGEEKIDVVGGSVVFEGLVWREIFFRAEGKLAVADACERMGLDHVEGDGLTADPIVVGGGGEGAGVEDAAAVEELILKEEAEGGKRAGEGEGDGAPVEGAGEEGPGESSEGKTKEARAGIGESEGEELEDQDRGPPFRALLREDMKGDE